MALREVENLEEGLKSYQDNRHVDLAQKKIEDVSWVSVTNFIVKVLIHMNSVCWYVE